LGILRQFGEKTMFKLEKNQAELIVEWDGDMKVLARVQQRP